MGSAGKKIIDASEKAGQQLQNFKKFVDAGLNKWVMAHGKALNQAYGN